LLHCSRQHLRLARSLRETIRKITPLTRAGHRSAPCCSRFGWQAPHRLRNWRSRTSPAAAVRFRKSLAVHRPPRREQRWPCSAPDELARRVTPRARAAAMKRATSPPISSAVIFLHVPLARGAKVPTRITHDVTAHFARRERRCELWRSAETPVCPDGTGRARAAPCAGKGYVLRRRFAAISIRPRPCACWRSTASFHLSQRFAVDWETDRR